MAKDTQQNSTQATRTNHCIICKSNTNYFFSKNYKTYPNSPFSETLKVDYWKCDVCGFVISKTHQEMTPNQWSTLNTSWHHYFENNLEARITNQPPYADQALALTILSKNNIVDLEDALDYAAGYGTLSKFLTKYFDTNIDIFDRYVRSDDKSLQYIAEEEIKKYRLVINSAMFEHVLNREALNEVNNLVADDGVLMLHTLICEKIPKDPDWFYITPMVHTAFHTNKSMEILMEQWGYAASIYSPQAKSWYLFKKDYPRLKHLEEKSNEINREIQTKYFHYKSGFVDYWKGF
jgi:2-polyprenyl-3-methyl-5-hydroxy-6-metoxy-1,4-benzoquinol methylase